MDNFDLKKFLVENKLTTNSKMLNENTGQGLDINLAKDIQSNPVTDKIRQQLERNPQLAAKAAKFVADVVDGKINLSEEVATSGPNRGHELTNTQDKVKQVLASAGLGTLTSLIITIAGGALAIGATGGLAIPIVLGSIIGGSLVGVGIGAAATNGFQRKLEEGDESIENELDQIIAAGREL